MLMALNRVCVGKRNAQCRSTPHSPNTSMHWALRARWTKAWKEEVCWVILSCRKALGKFPKEHLTLHIHLYQCKPMDTDNLYASVKPIVDGLKVNGGCGLIVDDDAKHLNLTVSAHLVQGRADEGVFLEIT